MAKAHAPLSLHRPLEAPRRAVARCGPAWDDNAELAAAVQAGDRLAMAAFFDRFSPDVLRILRRVLGADPELPDLVQEVFTRALRGIDQVNDPKALRGWLSSISVFVARECIRRRKRRWWLKLWRTPQAEVQAFETEVQAAPADWQARETLRSVYRILDGMGADERVVFTLRFFEGMELTEIASACGFSLATAKRRINKAKDAFWTLAQDDPAVCEWLERGER